MFTKRSVAAVLLCAMVLLMILVVVDECKAQGHNQEILEKKGLEGLFKGKGAADPRSPKPWQKWLGISSIFVMIAVVKYL